MTAGEQLWDYLYIHDVARGIVRAMDCEDAKGIFNLGSGRTVRLRSVVEGIRDRIDPSLPLGFGELPYRPDQIMRLEADISKLHRDLGWSPEVSLRGRVGYHGQMVPELSRTLRVILPAV